MTICSGIHAIIACHVARGDSCHGLWVERRNQCSLMIMTLHPKQISNIHKHVHNIWSTQDRLSLPHVFLKGHVSQRGAKVGNLAGLKGQVTDALALRLPLQPKDGDWDHIGMGTAVQKASLLLNAAFPGCLTNILLYHAANFSGNRLFSLMLACFHSPISCKDVCLGYRRFLPRWLASIVLYHARTFWVTDNFINDLLLCELTFALQ